MSVRFDASADGLIRTASVLDYNSAFTWMTWAYGTTFPTDFPMLMVVGSGVTPYNVDELGASAAASHKAWIEAAIAGSFGGVEATNVLTATQWYHVAMVRESATALKFYLDGSSVATDTLNITGRTAATQMTVGKRRIDSSDENPWNGRVAYMKAWASALTPTEVLAEKEYADAQKASPWGVWALTSHTDLTDSSGNGRNWTANGTLTTEADPTLSPPTPPTPLMFRRSRRAA